MKKPSPIVFIFLTIFIEFMGGSLLVPLIPYIVGQFQSDGFVIGLLVSSFSLAQFLAAPSLGALSDRFGRRPVLLLSLLGTGVGYVVFGLAHSLAWLFVGRLICGVAGGVVATAQAYIADISTPETRTQNFGLVGAAFGLGFILGPAIGGFLAQFSLQLPIFVAAGLAWSNAVLGYFTVTESLPPEKRQAVAWGQINPLTQLTLLGRNPDVRPFLLGFFIFNFAFAGFQSNFAVFTRDRFNWQPSENAWLFAYIGLISSLVQGLLIRTLLPRFGDAALARWGLVLAGLSVTGVALVPSGAWLYATQGIFALGVGLCLPTLRGLLSQRASAQEQGRVIGGSQSLASLAMVLGPLWAGMVYDQVGYTAPYWSAGAGIGLALVLINGAMTAKS